MTDNSPDTNDTSNNDPEQPEEPSVIETSAALAAKLLQRDEDEEARRVALWKEIQQHMQNTVISNGFDRSHLRITKSTEN